MANKERCTYPDTKSQAFRSSRQGWWSSTLRSKSKFEQGQRRGDEPPEVAHHVRGNIWETGTSVKRAIRTDKWVDYLRTRMVVAFSAASCARLSENGDSVLNRRRIRLNNCSSMSRSAKQQIAASFWEAHIRVPITKSGNLTHQALRYRFPGVSVRGRC